MGVGVGGAVKISGYFRDRFVVVCGKFVEAEAISARSVGNNRLGCFCRLGAIWA